MSIFGKTNDRVDETAELKRILSMPRRAWTEEALEDLAEKLTAVLKTPNGTMKLRPMQALALHDLYNNRGLAALMRVGSGKTLVSLLAPHVMGAQRPLLLLPAGLIDKTEREAEILREHWRIPKSIHMFSYEMLGLEQAAEFLDNKKPDLIIADECHKLKNKKAGRVKRLSRYMDENPHTVFAALSGTFMKHSIKDFARLLRWCLPNSCPVPRHDGEISEWADALDERVNPLQRRQAGALLGFCNQTELQFAPVQAARLGFQRRLTETAGIVTTAGDAVSCSLYIRALPYAMDPKMEKLFSDLRNEMVTPDGWDLTMATEIWRVAREMALGFHGVWDPRPPTPWRVSRKIWAKFVRDQLADSDHLDTEKQVKTACINGELDDHEYQDWLRMEPTFTIQTRDIWHDESALKAIEAWVKKNTGIIWVESVFVGEELSRRTGLPYFREDGKDINGLAIENADCSKCIIASFDSNKEGRNLQGRLPSQSEPEGWTGFSANLLTCPRSGADEWEQFIGRTHRDGQLADEVTVDVMIGCKEHYDAWVSALAGARASRDTLGGSQKILLADVDMPAPEEIARLHGNLWRKTPPKK